MSMQAPWLAEFADRVRFSESMARHTSWHAGGPADVLFSPRDDMDLATFLRKIPLATDVLWIGLGSNLLVRDGGIRGAVVSLHGALKKLSRLGENLIEAQAGVPCARLARQCVKWGLGPAEFFAGIPGTVGGALAMNAGAFGGETWDHVIDVDVLDRSGTRRTLTRGDFRIGYRSVETSADNSTRQCFIAARLKFDLRPEAHADAIRDLLAHRRATQPIGEWSCGSVFANPQGDHAARLIETAGLKGFRIGDASVSEKHANFIVNHGAARAADLEAVILHVQAVVRERFDIELKPEVRIVGEPA